MSSYFLIKYLISLSLFTKIQMSVTDIQTIFGRLQCSQSIINKYIECFFNPLSGIQTEFASLNTKIDQCMNLEMGYTSNIISAP